MFFWGSYNFQAPQLTEHEERPPLRFPMYIPPTPALCTSDPSRKTMALTLLKADDAEVQAALRDITAQQLRIKRVACGAKHIVLVLGVSNPNHCTGAEGEEGNATELEAVYGLGSNHSGQLGKRVATYANTLTNLHMEEVLEGRVVGVACGARHTLLCTSTGCVYASGDNSLGQLGLSTHFTASARACKSGGDVSCITAFTQLTTLAHVRAVYASANASFALDARGQLYSWGDAQYGHLGHNDTGERLDPATLKLVTENVHAPQLVRWFERHRVVLVEVAVGRAHLVCRSEEDVYTCGEGYFGKLGHGDVQPRLEPARVEFPPRKQTERLVSIAAGDDHTLVLKANPAIGSVVYYFGKLSNLDGQLTPVVVTVPSMSLMSVFAGKGNMSLCLSSEGTLYVWGKHSYTKVYNGTEAAAARSHPSPVTALSPFKVEGVAVGGTCVVAYASGRHAAVADAAEETAGAGGGAAGSVDHSWDVVVPHDARAGKGPAGSTGDPEETYEEGVRRFLEQYLGEALGEAYVRGMPAAPPKTEMARYQYEKIATANLTVGQKVRLWMTDIYAIGKITKVLETADRAKEELEESEVDHDAGAHPCCAGRRVGVEWERSDWKDEVLTLYSDDETLDETNTNRWQPFWFEQDAAGEYLIPRIRRR